MARRYRAAAIGSTGKGNFGHGLDTVFKDLDGVDFVALADDNPEGLQETAKKTGVKNLYADYREMLAKEKPDLVSVGPRWLAQRVPMVTAAAEAGCHIYCEKPFAASLAEADVMLAACAKAGVHIAVAHQFRAAAPVRLAVQNLKAGKYGKVVRLRSRPKDDARGGGEELIIHGTHLFDMMAAIAGPPRWVAGHVTTAGRDVAREDKRQGTEPIGPIAGDAVAASFGFDNGVHGFFDSNANLFRSDRTPYGLLIECEEALLAIRSPGDVHVYPAATAIPENPKFAWQKLWVEDWHFTPDHKPRPTSDWLQRGNQIIVKDLLDSVAEKRKPLAAGEDARLALEMIFGVYASHLAGGTRMAIPLKERRHPLGE